MFCPNCGMLKSNCVCGYCKNSGKSISNNQKMHKKINDNSESKISISTKKSNKEESIPENIPKTIYLNSSNTQEEILSEISDSIKGGYKFIVLEANEGNSDIAVKLAKNFDSSIILTSNEKSQMRYDNKYDLGKDSKIHLSNHKSFFDERSRIEKGDLLIIDEAHRLDENIVDLFSYEISLYEYREKLKNFRYDVKDLPKKDHKIWFNLIKHLSLVDDEIMRVQSCIEENPENWICSYDTFQDEKLIFYPLNIGNLAKKYWFTMGQVCILISSTILDFDLFVNELGLDSSKVKFIQHDLPINSEKNKIYGRKTANMRKDNLKLLIPIIEEILKKHKAEKGLIITDKRDYSYRISRQIKDQRLIIYEGQDYNNRIKKFNEGFNSVFVTSSLEDGIEFPYDQCKFQIIVKEHMYSYNQRSINKDNEYGWYSYKQTVNLVDLLQRPITSESDYCTTYILDERILTGITMDILHNKRIPKYIIDLIADLDMEDKEFVSNSIKKQFGVYYLFDYFPDKKTENKEILAYKNYDKEFPNRNLEEFNFFTTKLKEAISKLSNDIIDSKINRIALIAVPSSTIERNESATMKESINAIENWYDDGKRQSDFDCKKEIINCGDLLKRVSDVSTSHLSKTSSKERPSYLQHINSIGCETKDVLKMEDAVFIIMDDISTRGTIMNACEDILVENGAKKENIFKFAIYKTQSENND